MMFPALVTFSNRNILKLKVLHNYVSQRSFHFEMELVIYVYHKVFAILNLRITRILDIKGFISIIILKRKFKYFFLFYYAGYIFV